MEGKPFTRFLEGDTKSLAEAPRSSILPFDEWPEEVPRSYVRATDSEGEVNVK